MTKVREVIASVNDFVNVWNKNSALIVKLFGDKDVSELEGIINFIKGFLNK